MTTETIVWSKDGCPFCVRAVELLESKGIEFDVRKIGDGWSREDLLEAVPNARTVPQIFLNGEHVGGYIQLEERLRG